MNAVGRALSVVVGAWILAGCAGTQEATRDVQDIVPGVSQKETGLIQSVGHNQVSVVGIANQPGSVTFSVSPKTVVVRENQRIELSQLEAGTPVRVAFESTAGAERATTIEVLTGEAADKVRREVHQGTGTGY